MNFKKIALVTAIACAPMSVFAVEAMDDADLSAATGQDGIVIGLTLAVDTNVLIHDKDGIGSVTGYSFDGAIVIENMAINAGGVTVTIDAGDSSNTTNAPVLNVNVALSSAFTVSTGTIGVANSNRDAAPTAWGAEGAISTIINNSDIVIGATALNIQLGAAEPQGNMIAIDASITGGLTINNFGINDVTTGGTLGATSMTIVDTGGGANLTVDVGIDIDEATGLVIDINQLGTLAGGMDVRIIDQYLGSTGAGIVGDVEVQGLNLSGTLITIRGN